MISETLTAFIGTVNSIINQKGNNVSRMGEDELALTSIFTTKGRNRSITRGIEDSVAYYPVVISDTISPDIQIELSKINEGRVAEYIRIIIETTDTTLDLNDSKNVGEFMSRFKDSHQIRMADTAELFKEGLTLEDYDMMILMQETFENLSEIDLPALKEAVASVKANSLSLTEASSVRKVNPPPSKGSGSKTAEPKDKANRKIDVRKTNNISPTVMTASINVMGRDGRLQEQSVMLAIKSMIHSASGQELMDALLKRNRSGNLITRLVKWYTGEIDFVKDVLLDIENIRDEEVSSDKRGATLINKLLAVSRAKTDSSSLGKETFLPTTTLVISVDDVEYLKNISNSKIDLLNEKHAKLEMDKMSLMTIIVVDELNDIGYMFDDGIYTTYTSFRISNEKQRSEANTNKMMKLFVSGSQKGG